MGKKIKHGRAQKGSCEWKVMRITGRKKDVAEKVCDTIRPAVATVGTTS